MNIIEFYDNTNNDYHMVKEGLESDKRIYKFLLRFLNEYDRSELESAMKADDKDECIRLVHTIKGTSINLGLTQVSSLSADICQRLREGNEVADEKDAIDSLHAMIDSLKKLVHDVEKIE